MGGRKLGWKVGAWGMPSRVRNGVKPYYKAWLELGCGRSSHYKGGRKPVKAGPKLEDRV